MRTKILLAFLGSAWSLFVFSVVLWASFPSDAVRDRIRYEANEQSGGMWQVSMASVRPWTLPGLTVKDLSLAKKARRKSEEASELLRLEELDARLQLLPLLRGALMVGLDADLYGGGISGKVGKDGTLLVIDVEGQDLDLSQYPISNDSFKADLGGRLKVVADLELDQEESKKSEGSLRLEADDMTVSGLSVMGFNIGDAAFSESVLEFDIKEGKAEVVKGSFLSDLVEITVEGDVTLRNPIKNSLVHLKLNVKLSDELDKLARMAPGVKESRDADGIYHFNVSGTLDRPSFKDERKRGSKRTPGLSGAAVNPGGDYSPDEDPEERKRRREERMAERRKKLEERRAAAKDPSGEEELPEEPSLEEGQGPEAPNDELEPFDPNIPPGPRPDMEPPPIEDFQPPEGDFQPQE